jgi:hypothetical protein
MRYEQAAMTDPDTWPARLRKVERYERLRHDHLALRDTITSNSKEFGKRVDAIQHLLVKIAFALMTGMAGILATLVFFK